MSASENEPLYRHGGGALLRAAAVSLNATPDEWPDLNNVASCRTWLKRVWAVWDFADAVGQASPALSSRVEAINAGGTFEPKVVLRAAAATLRYLLRAVGRPTPFGLFAGVAPVSVGPSALVRWGSRHRAVARVDTQWLTDVIDRLEAVPELLERLDVVCNDLAVHRGARWEVPRGPHRANVRYTRAVAEAHAAAGSPVRFTVLTDKLVDAFPGAGATSARRMLTDLIRQGFLISCLRAPLTVVDPLAYLMQRLRAVEAAAIPSVAPLIADLATVYRQLRGHNEPGVAGGRAAIRAQVAQPIRRLSSAGRTPLAVDLRLDCEVEIPRHVIKELEQAASVLLRLTRRATGEPVWHNYHAEFCARYGTGTLVPVTDVVDADAGLGYPAGYPGSVHTRRPLAASERDEVLLALAWQAIADDSHEIVLSETTTQALTEEGFDPRYIPPHVELAARIHASSTTALNDGDYTLTVAPARSAGTLTSRFTVTATGTGLDEVYKAVPLAIDGALPVQMSFPPQFPHAENVCRIPAYLPQVMTLGEHRSTGDGVITLDDLAISADLNRLYLVSLSRRRLVEPQVFHALSLEKQPPPLARFLAHLSRAFSASWHEFDWGPHFHRLPYLPRIRHGRTVLSPARWRLTSNDLPPATAGNQAWHQALDRWRQRWRCPDIVELRAADRTLRMDLAEQAHLTILRTRIDRDGEAAFTEAASSDDFGWIGGHAHEIAIPLVRTGSPAPSPEVRTAPTITNRHGHLPGSGRWLSAKLFTHPERLDELIARYLPTLLASLDGQPTYWFIRYRGPHERDHLRLRLSTSDRGYGACMRNVGDWAQNLRDDSVIADVVLDSYFPETGRYGAGTAMDSAEAVFAADSRAAVTALQQLPTMAIDRLALTAIGMLDIVHGFLGNRAEAVSWLVNRPITATSPDRTTAEQAVRWAVDSVLPGRAELPTALVDAMRDRAAALATYREALAPSTDTNTVLGSLLHLHHNRILGIDPESEATCRRLARQAALAWRVQDSSRAS
ncbi:lantibiotic dehydratase [Virgisporangium aurantiacum]|uniref:Thiopeptide-type bacteriocin biosynthesis domain-containing protein n=1 Tax=Virgisporangium aurantiacum TaxID=175570 RepID=A0A8J3Z6E6_9ACTN|nr:lantibiotic dehydratase [Virgisporangium aurantiacum]GIJ56085.1 hypothetical protein Vau01_036010 [Virgisporangium aurantiacum]